jgi:hypothetical protein
MKKTVAAFTIAIISAAQSFAGGIIFYTSGGSPYINVVQYETYSAPSAHLSYITVKGGQRTQIQSAGIIPNIPLPTTGADYSLEDIQVNIAQADAMGSRQPKYAQAMQKVSQLWNDQIPAAEAREKQRKIEEAASKKKADAVGKNFQPKQSEGNSNQNTPHPDSQTVSRSGNRSDLVTEEVIVARKSRDDKIKNETEIEIQKLKNEKGNLIAQFMDPNSTEYKTKLDNLRELAGDIFSFNVIQKLSLDKFPVINKLDGDLFEINLNGDSAILATKYTRFNSSGVGELYMKPWKTVEITTDKGFQKTVRVYNESSPEMVKTMMDFEKHGNAILAIEAQPKKRAEIGQKK